VTPRPPRSSASHEPRPTADEPPADATPGTSPFKSTSGLARIVRAAGYSLSGLLEAWRHEHAFRQELAIALPLVVIAVFVDTSPPMRALMIASVLGVLVVELLNSAVEAVVDRVSLDRHPLAGRAKDLGSAAVMLSIVIAAAVWGIALFG